MVIVEHNEVLYERGKQCSLWDVDAVDMTREQLLVFIGFLDELVEMERAGTAPKGK